MKPAAVTVSVRLPLGDYEQTVALAEQRQTKTLGPILRDLVRTGLKHTTTAPPTDNGDQ